MRLWLGFFGIVVAAFGQMDGAKFSSDLNAKYGPPLARQIFLVKTGFELTVDYSANGNICEMRLPPRGPERDTGTLSPKGVDDFLKELLPLAIRGKELGRIVSFLGLASVSTVEYENVLISESFQGTERKEITVTFPKDHCAERAVR
jgi:hypothetical protein